MNSEYAAEINANCRLLSLTSQHVKVSSENLFWNADTGSISRSFQIITDDALLGILAVVAKHARFLVDTCRI